MSILEVRDLTKVFGGKTVVDQVSFSLKEGEILGMLGPNGAGKTTTMQMVIGTLTPSSGSITAFGLDLATHRSEIAERINFSSTYTNLPWRLTVKENLTWASYLYEIADRPKRLDRIREIFRLSELWNKSITDLSAGQQTRVNLAKACLNFPRILILDEPTASLDPEVAEYIHSFLKKERGEFKTSIILTSHNMAEVEDLCDRVLVLKGGKIVAEDTPAGLAHNVTKCRLSLRVTSPLTKSKQKLKSLKLNHRWQGPVLTLTLEESDIASLVSSLPRYGITYSEISIAKPTLQDFFLQVAKDNSGRES